jgi:hypothetical protein
LPNNDHLSESRPRLRPADSARHLARRFVREIDANDGVAWCAEVSGNVARLRYVDIPGVIEGTRRVPVDNIRSVELSNGTRIWIPVKPFGWIPAEIVGPHGRGRYWVRLRGEVKAHSLWSHEFCVRWNRPLSDPVAAVAHGIVTGWDFYAARQPLVRNVVRQRAAYQGFAGAASAAVLPFQHQLDVLSRVTAATDRHPASRHPGRRASPDHPGRRHPPAPAPLNRSPTAAPRVKRRMYGR